LDEEEGEGSGQDDRSDVGDRDSSSEKSCNMHRPYEASSKSPASQIERNPIQKGLDYQDMSTPRRDAAAPIPQSRTGVVPVSRRSLFVGALSRTRYSTGRTTSEKESTEKDGAHSGAKPMQASNESGSINDAAKGPSAFRSSSQKPSSLHIKTDYEDMNEDRDDDAGRFTNLPSPSSIASPGHTRHDVNAARNATTSSLSIKQDELGSGAELSSLGSTMTGNGASASGSDRKSDQKREADVSDKSDGNSKRRQASISESSTISAGSQAAVVFTKKSDLSVPSDINEAVRLYRASSKLSNYVALWKRLPDHVIARAIFVRKWSIYFDTVCRVFLAQHRQHHPPRRYCPTCLMPSCVDINETNHSCDNYGLPPAWIPKSTLDDAMIIYFEILDALKTHKFENFKFS
jgi:hypothetical protein